MKVRITDNLIKRMNHALSIHDLISPLNCDLNRTELRKLSNKGYLEKQYSRMNNGSIRCFYTTESIISGLEKRVEPKEMPGEKKISLFIRIWLFIKRLFDNLKRRLK